MKLTGKKTSALCDKLAAYLTANTCPTTLTWKLYAKGGRHLVSCGREYMTVPAMADFLIESCRILGLDLTTSGIEVNHYPMFKK